MEKERKRDSAAMRCEGEMKVHEKSQQFSKALCIGRNKQAIIK